jgi:two-component system response regulator AtoC
VNSFVEDLGRFQTASPKMLSVVAEARRVAKTLNPVLILGDEGSGRRELALEIFDHSVKHSGRLVRWNADSFAMTRLLPKDTVLVENIENLSLEQQRQLLELISEGLFEKGQQRRRWMATGCRNLMMMVRKESFLLSLYQVISVQTLNLPSLKERSEDLVDLSCRFVADWNLITGLRKTLSPAALQRIQNLEFVRNVQELSELIERGYHATNGTVINEESFGFEFEESRVKAGVSLSEMEKLLILQTLEMTKQNRTRAAEILGISIRTLRNKLSEYREDGSL